MGLYSLKSPGPRGVEMSVKWIRNTVATFGLNPDTATFADLKQCEAQVLCLRCAE